MIKKSFKNINLPYISLFYALNVFLTFQSLAQKIPYPPSEAIAGIEIEWKTHQRYAPGSDNFPLTWADDNHQYAIWGDGGGFSGTNSKYRVAFGVVRIEGAHNDFKAFDRYGDKESSEYEAKITGKSWGIICVTGVLYAWVHPDKKEGWGNWENHHSESRLYMSKNKGASWQPASWAFTPDEGLLGGGILQYGKNYAGAKDDYVYHYFAGPTLAVIESSTGLTREMRVPGYIYLLRAHKNELMNKDAFEFFAGMKNNQPVWTKDVEKKENIFYDVNGVATPMAISYNKGLKRYLLTVSHGSDNHDRGLMGLFDAPAPWGPWTTVEYSTTDTWFGYDNEEIPQTVFFWNFPTKWMSRNGKKASLNFSGGSPGIPVNDSFNTVRVRFKTK